MSDCEGRADVRWAPRVKKHLVRRLYEADAMGIVDDELIDEVGYTLWARCRSILDVHDARHGRIRCPRCERAGIETIIDQKAGREAPIVCPVCGWATTWLDYSRTFKRRQLHSGGALDAFTAYMRRFEAARTPREKLLAIDQVIHEFHYSLRTDPDLPTRAAAANLIEGDLTDVMVFLDALTRGPEAGQTYAQWRESVSRLPWNPMGTGAEDAE